MEIIAQLESQDQNDYNEDDAIQVDIGDYKYELVLDMMIIIKKMNHLIISDLVRDNQYTFIQKIYVNKNSIIN